MNNFIRITLIGLSLVYLACNESLEDYIVIPESEVVPYIPKSECHEGINALPPPRTNCPSADEEECQIIDENFLHPLSTDILKQFPNFCMNAPERIYFKGTSGAYQAFELVEKQWYHEKDLIDDECPLGHTYCYTKEVAFIRLKSLNQDHHLIIRFETPRVFDTYVEEGTSLTIEGFGDPYLIKGFIEPFAFKEETTFFFDYKLNGTNYNSVLVGKPTNPRSIKQLYYSLELGLLGFIDKHDEIWELVN